MNRAWGLACVTAFTVFGIAVFATRLHNQRVALYDAQPVTCPVCAGRMFFRAFTWDGEWGWEQCPGCDGAGTVRRDQATTFPPRRLCPDCSGNGRVWTKGSILKASKVTCPWCEGRGIVHEVRCIDTVENTRSGIVTCGKGCRQALGWWQCTFCDGTGLRTGPHKFFPYDYWKRCTSCGGLGWRLEETAQ